MADARALLRAHRAENRIKHPHAAYSDAGKLLCKLCHDVVKAESLWDTHIRGQAHRQRLQALQQQQQQQQQQTRQPSPLPQDNDMDESAHKRKRSDDDNEPMSDAEDGPDATRAKRSRTDTVDGGNGSGADGNKESNKDREMTQASPGLVRRTSGTPVHGVEIAIPSRPATPLAGSNSTVSTPKAASIGRSTLAGSETSSVSGGNAAASAQQQTATSIPISNDFLTIPSQNTAAQTSPSSNTGSTAQGPSSGAIDEDEWAAFEAEMSALDAPAPAPPNGPSQPYVEATISAPALTTAQLAAKSQEEENERRKQAAETEMADEREDATRALETEFEEMEELEGRVRRLKQRREQLRKESVMNLRTTASTTTAAGLVKAGAVDGKENVRSADKNDAIEEDDDEDDEEDDFDGFRFRV